MSAVSQTGERRLAVWHETSYEYASQVDLSHHLAHLQPRELDYQSVTGFSLLVEPQTSDRSSMLDVYGNIRTFFSLYSPHDKLCVRASSQVTVRPRFGNIAPADSEAWDSVSDDLRYVAQTPYRPETEFVFASAFVPVHTELRDYARSSFSPGRPLLQAAIELMSRVYEDFEYSSEATEVSTPVLEAFEGREGVCQDFAHVMIGCFRALGLPARYVSGYLLTNPPPGKPRLVGADASHAWLQVHCPLHGWVDLDPTNNVVPGTSHVTLAIGRDYGDVMPLAGIIRGGGEHTLEVAVDVAPLDGD